MLVHLNILGASSGAPFFVIFVFFLHSILYSGYYANHGEHKISICDIDKLKKMLEKDQNEKIMSEIRKIRKKYFEETVAVITDSNRFN